jgi:hypothetical protein
MANTAPSGFQQTISPSSAPTYQNVELSDYFNNPAKIDNGSIVTPALRRPYLRCEGRDWRFYTCPDGYESKEPT